MSCDTSDDQRAWQGEMLRSWKQDICFWETSNKFIKTEQVDRQMERDGTNNINKREECAEWKLFGFITQHHYIRNLILVTLKRPHTHKHWKAAKFLKKKGFELYVSICQMPEVHCVEGRKPPHVRLHAFFTKSYAVVLMVILFDRRQNSNAA